MVGAWSVAYTRATAVIEWLLDADPSIRWQVMRDLTDAAPDDVAAERARVAVEGCGARLLALQGPDGQWDGGTYRPGWVDDSKPFFDAWTATTYSLLLLRDLGVAADDPVVRRAIALVRDNTRWEATDTPFFDGETEPCINGTALAIGAYFGQDVDGIVKRVLGDQLDDGGWNCWAEYGATVSSFNTTICVLEGLLEWERAGGSSEAIAAARRKGETYLLDRRLLRRRTSGQIIDPRFTMFSFPTRWYYDVLRGLDYFRAAGEGPDDRCAEAIALVADKRDEDGRWTLENTHMGPTHFEMEGPDGFPSRWNTLRAMRVLRWASRRPR
jgi:phage tail protein X